MTPGVPERWLVLRLRRPDDDDRAGLLSAALVDLGGRAVWEREGDLVTHVPEPADPEAWLEDARRRLAASAPFLDEPVELESEWQLQEEWAEIWKAGLAPRRVTDRLVVTPSWCAYEPEPGDLVITLDPGMAFGNAEHGTTRGCLRLLDRAVRAGDRVLDVGAGSGVLSIAAALLGASRVLALDSDPWAVAAARENAARNGVAARVEVREACVAVADLHALPPHDLVAANIEAGVLTALLPGLAAAAPGGRVVLGGILAEELIGVERAAAAEGLAPVAVDEDGEWRSLLLRQPGD